MYQRKATVNYEWGLHARPVAIIVEEAGSYQADLILKKGTAEASLKSLLGLLSLGIEYQEEIIISGEGSDEKEAVDSLVDLIENRLDNEVKSNFVKQDKDNLKQKVDEELEDANKYNFNSAKLISLIGKEVKNKISHIKELVSEK